MSEADQSDVPDEGIEILRTVLASLESLTGRVAQLEDPDAADENADGPEPTDRDEASEIPRAWSERAGYDEWVALTDWVDWINTFYSLPKKMRIHPCWPRHGGIVEELAGLHATWRSAMLTDDIERHIGEAATAFHTQWLWPVLRRIFSDYDMAGFTAAGGCTDRTCILDSDKYEEPEPTDRSRFVGVDKNGVILDTGG